MIKNLGLNGIRTEGKQMPDDFYEQMDRAGILIDGGYPVLRRLAAQPRQQLDRPATARCSSDSALTIGENLRNHPSVLNFSWSDNAPTRAQEQVSLAGFAQADFQDPLIASAEYKTDPPAARPVGREGGPVRLGAAELLVRHEHYDPDDSTRTNVGGAWAFDSEASAGHTIPTLDSIKRFLSPFEQDAAVAEPRLQPVPRQLRARPPGPDNGGYSFGTLHDLDAAICRLATARGRASSQYVEEAQVQNYETQRAEFEAYIDHSTNQAAPSTGIVYWQLNKGWPTLLWDLYNYDFDQAGSYFGAKKANEPLHVLYAYDTGPVSVDNLAGLAQRGLSVESKVYGVDGTLLDDQTANGISVDSQGVAQGRPASRRARHHAAADAGADLLRRAAAHAATVTSSIATSTGSRRSRTSSTGTRTIGNPQATMTPIREPHVSCSALGGATVRVTADTQPSWGGAGGGDTETDVTITNISTKPTVAFFLRADVRRGSRRAPPRRATTRSCRSSGATTT